MLRALIDVAREWRCGGVVLETSTAWTEAVAFYLAAGFTHTHDEDGTFGSDSWFRLDL